MSSKNKIDISEDGYVSLMNNILTNLQEERDLALDRYRIQDGQMVSPEDFVLQGKDVVSYLKLASERTNTLLSIAKEIKELAFADQLNKSESKSANASSNLNDRKAMEAYAKEIKEGKRTIDDIKDDEIKGDDIKTD